MNAFRRLTIAAVALSAAPAFADEPTIVHTDSLIVVTPNAPVIVQQGQPVTSPQQVDDSMGGYATPPQGYAPPPPPPMAQPVYAPPVPPAPYNEPWDNVNHINGRLVKVGEKGDYLLKYKKTNIATNPIGWMFRIYGLSVSHAMSDNVAIRGDANIFESQGDSGYEVGISAPIYFRRVYSGPFIEPGIIARGFSNSCSDCGSSSDSMVGPEILFGWHWSFDSGFNVAFAFGAARSMNNSDSQSSSSSDPQPAGYFRIGYAM